MNNIKIKNNKIIKFLLMIIIMVLTIILGTTSSKALQYYYIGPNNFYGNGNIYCIAHSSDMPNGYYYVYNTITIEGNKATDYYGRVATSSANARLAYILGGGSGYGSGYGPYYGNVSDRQRALWAYYSTWRYWVGWNFDLGYLGDAEAGQSWYGSTTQLWNEAIEYANSTKTTASIKSNKTTVTTSNSIAGPFKVTYTGSISEVIVYDSNNNEVSGLEFYTNSKCKAESKINSADISSGKNFYIKNETGKKLSKLKISVSASNVLGATIYFLKSVNAYQQDLIEVYPKYEPSTASVTINLNTETDLTIKKVDGLDILQIK